VRRIRDPVRSTGTAEIVVAYRKKKQRASKTSCYRDCETANPMEITVVIQGLRKGELKVNGREGDTV
jgi:hypothetical protein